MASLTSLGAAQEVTGSRYLLETLDGVKVLLECGMRQGRREADNGNRAPFPFDPASIDAGGHLPRPPGPQRPAAAPWRPRASRARSSPPRPPAELLELMLLDSAHIQEKDAEWENRWRNRIGKPSIKPLYTQADTERAPSCAGRSASAAPWRSRSWRAGDLSQRRAHPRLVDRRSAIPRPGATAPPGVFRRPRQHLLAVDARALAAEAGPTW